MAASSQHFSFHVGKGGVGKSTTSTLSALHLARGGKKVLLVSLDPAHNQCDILDTQLGPDPKEVAPNLHVAQADIDTWVAEYLRGIESQIRRTYTYQTAFNLEKHLGVIKHSPGIEEYALLLAFRSYANQSASSPIQAEVVVFDMPPTALATKFFHLPTLSLIWVEELLTLRQEIIKKKEIITKIQVGKAEFERDKITCKLNEQQSFFQELKELFQDKERCAINIVVNPDKLSFAEAERVEATLKDLNIGLGAVIMNKVGPDGQWDAEMPFLTRNIVRALPLSSTPLIGLDVLCGYLDGLPGGFPV